VLVVLVVVPVDDDASVDVPLEVPAPLPPPPPCPSSPSSPQPAWSQASERNEQARRSLAEEIMRAGVDLCSHLVKLGDW